MVQPRLKVLLGVYPGDTDTVSLLLQWCADLGKQDADLVIVAEGDLADQWNGAGFTSKTVLRHPCPVPVRDMKMEATILKGDYLRAEYPDSPFFWMEHDSIPLCRDWLAKIVKAHGPDLETTASGNLLPSIPPHDPMGPFMNGVALYPAQYRVIPPPLGCCILASDRTNSRLFHPKLRFIENVRMVHVWGGEFMPGLVCEDGVPSFPGADELEFLRQTWPDAALFHRNKDGSLIVRLREEWKDLE